MHTITATPMKLRSGKWGAKVHTTDVAEGDQITITTKAGKSWTAIVERVIWTGDDVAIVATANRQARRYRSYDDYGCSYCRGGGLDMCTRCGFSPM